MRRFALGLLAVLALLCQAASAQDYSIPVPDFGRLERDLRLKPLQKAQFDIAVEASQRFVRCVVDSFDEAGVPADPEVRQAITDYVTWAALGPFQAWGRSADDVPDDLPMPHWDWDGPS